MPEPGSGFRSGGTPGGRWGCLVTATVVACCLPLIFILTWAFGKTNDWFLHAWLPVLLTAVVVGIAVRALMNWEWRGRADAETGTPAWVIASVAAAAIAAVALLYIGILPI